MMLNKKSRVIFRVDCSHEVGMGHLMRCTYLSKYLDEKLYDKIFVVKGYEDKYLSGDLEVIFLEADVFFEDEVKLIKDLALGSKESYLICDFATKYTFQQISSIDDYFMSFRNVFEKVLLIDGMGVDSVLHMRKDIPVDYIVTPYIGAEECTDAEFSHLCGVDYFVFNKNMINVRKSKEQVLQGVSNILVTMGGGDPSDMSIFVVRELMLDSYFESKNIKIVIGPHFTKTQIEELQKLTVERESWDLITNIDDLSSFFSWSDIAISSSGLTKYELAMTRTPSILISHNANAMKISMKFDNLNVAKHLGAVQEIQHGQLVENITRLCEDKKMREELWENCCERFNGAGGMLVLQEMGIIGDCYE